MNYIVYTIFAFILIVISFILIYLWVKKNYKYNLQKQKASDASLNYLRVMLAKKKVLK
ncbi:MAG: hypothetical protein LBL77_00685 [Endomicrobium sp.]|jgi:uncharacterized membrane protein|nr:hypothetical protein [Endomicrobium sp.]